MRFGFLVSLLMHAAVVGAAFLTFPFMARPDVSPEPYVPVELIKDAELDLTTSVPAAAPEVVDEPEPEPDVPEPEIEEPAAPVDEPEPETQPEPEPEPAPVEIEEEPEQEPEPVEEPEPVKEPEPESDELDFDALSALIDREQDEPRAAPRETPSEVTEQADQPRAAIGAGDRLTASDEAKMRAAVERCWNASAIIGAPEPEKLLVTIDFELNRDGSLTSPPRVANALQINLSGNRFWKVAEREALAAVVKCAPYDFLPLDRYQTWKEFKLNFDPSQMAGF